jgi:Protein of unknown function (DUF1553)/Protein of unknown function (DUF1549)
VRRSLLLLLVAFGSTSAQERPYQEPDLPAKARDHWAFKPPVRVNPDRKGGGDSTNPIDAFILARLDKEGLKPSPEADKLTLIRRLTFDLHGLPPTPAEIDAFLKDMSANAYEKVVDRLLASPHFGERWAQHWLDVVRFAESNGYELDGERPHAWRYRDYVVNSFNADKPYDRFLTEQIAGDLLAKDKPTKEAAELWVATGMHRCGPIHMVSGNLDPEETRQEKLIEIVNGFGAAVLGLTMACTRCHDHKFDPLTQGDYFRLQAFFGGTKYQDVEFATAAEKSDHKDRTGKVLSKVLPLKKRISDIEAPYRKKLDEEKKAKLPEAMRAAVNVEAAKRTPEQKKLAEAAKPLLKVTWDEVLDALTPEHRAERAKLKDEQLKLEEGLPEPLPAAWAIADSSDAKPTFVLKRGDWKRKQSQISAGYVRVVADAPPEPKTRLDLAKWVTDPKHPLTARVIVNRLWQHHFGRGIVATPNDFGTRGERPTHPELLDWLACELVNPERQGGGDPQPWALKRMHKRMVMSATYRQASDTPPSPAAAKADPDNALLWRMNRRRLDGEAVRDAMLTAAGTLTRTVGGASVKVPLEPEVYDLLFTEDEPVGLWRITPDPAQHTRRSLYLFAKRNVRQPLLEAFDQPDTLGSCAVRGVSTFAPQALILMNGPLAQEQSKWMAAELMKTGKPEEWITAAYRRALGRPPTEQETKRLAAFFDEQAKLIGANKAAGKPIGEPSGLPDGADPVRARALADVCLALFNLNEFVFVP